MIDVLWSAKVKININFTESSLSWLPTFWEVLLEFSGRFHLDNFFVSLVVELSHSSLCLRVFCRSLCRIIVCYNIWRSNITCCRNIFLSDFSHGPLCLRKTIWASPSALRVDVLLLSFWVVSLMLLFCCLLASDNRLEALQWLLLLFNSSVTFWWMKLSHRRSRAGSLGLC